MGLASRSLGPLRRRRKLQPRTFEERIVFKFVTLYRRVDDEISLDNFFHEVHLPLAESLPGLRKRELARVTSKPGGESRYYLMFELYFDSEEAWLEALATRAGVDLIRELLPWAEARIITWFYAETYEEDMAI